MVVRLVAAREMRQRVATRSFWAFTALLIVLILAGGVIIRIVSGDSRRPEVVSVGVVGGVPGEFEQRLVSAASLFDRRASLVRFPDAATARQALGDDEVDVAVIPADGEVVFASDVDEQVLGTVQQAWSSAEIELALADRGLSGEEIAAALSPTPLDAVTLDEDEDVGERAGQVVGTMTTVMLYIAVVTYGTYVLNGVVEEKSTSVVEVLLARARPERLLAGKVIGIGVAGMAQIALAVAALVVALAISGLSVPAELWSSLPSVLVWFLGGYALYSTLYALAGALVSRQEDAQSAAWPITGVLIVTYLIAYSWGTQDSIVGRVLSVLPPMAPLLMPARMAAGTASVGWIAAALVLLLGSVALAWILTGRIYEQVVLQRGTRISWRSALALLRRGAAA